MLIGSSDSRITDRGKLRVTVHHNEFRDLGQRVPRVRFGQVDIYNNHYVQRTRCAIAYVYSWGVGVESHLVAEQNAFTLAPGSMVPSHRGVQRDLAMTENDNRVNGEPVDIVAAYNAAFDPDITEVPAFTPLPRRTLHPAGPSRGWCRHWPVLGTSASGSGSWSTGADAATPRPCRVRPTWPDGIGGSRRHRHQTRPLPRAGHRRRATHPTLVPGRDRRSAGRRDQSRQRGGHSEAGRRHVGNHRAAPA